MSLMPRIQQETTRQTLLAQGDGWSVSDVVCRSGPEDAPYEEQHGPTVVAAVLSGNFLYRSTHGTALMAAGSLMLGNAGACYRCSHEHGVGDRCIAFHFAPDFMEEMARDLPGLRRRDFPLHRLPPVPALAPLVASAGRALERPGDMEGLALRMAGAALRLSRTDAPIPLESRGLARIADAVALIEARYAEPLSVAEIAREVGLSRYHFLRLFAATMNVTPYQYLIGRRLRAAAALLPDRSRTVLDIALSVGFGDLSEFTRRFRRVFGKTPSDFRNR
ncbi:hypothetical protein AUP43_13465 [Oceanibaculum pacificum]|uniref:HTH araC/xylS-type domain-containing protein n=2 Tax=Oceanibaculum pacificum TaxID=580166 RepID=A0A154VNJ7_9PROT|nr:hypothetical protein AUP43_13465 [Oceanibaculum pacificum]